MDFSSARNRGGGCTQDSLNTDYNTNSMSRPSWISGGIPEMQAVILSPEESYREPGGASLRGDCDNDYVLQIRRISSNTGNIPLRVFSKDADDAGYSAMINIINFNNVSSITWVTVLLYDEDLNEICFGPDDNLGFIQPNDFDEDIEFEVRLYNVSTPDSTADENILWEAFVRYYYTMYPVTSGNPTNMNPASCSDFDMEAQSVATSVGTMWFVYPWDATAYDFTVPPTDGGNHNATNLGPILSYWESGNHVTGNGYGSLEFTCDQTTYTWQIGSNQSTHGILLDPDGRMCRLEH